MTIQPKRLNLVPQTLAETRAMIAAMSPAERAEVSADWLAKLENSPDSWTLGFSLVLVASGEVVGSGGFKGPPDAEGMVEIAYGVSPEHAGKGYGTEAAEALTNYAFESGEVHVVRAHTLEESNASARILAKNGFRKVGEVMDPEDGLVWRWEKPMA